MLRATTLLALLPLIWGLTLASAADAADTYGPNAPGNLIVNTVVSEKASALTSSLLSDRISQAVSSGVSVGSAGGGQIGAAAGSGPRDNGFWLTAGGNLLKDKLQNQGFRGTISTLAGGVDRWITDRLLVGVAGGHEQVNVDTYFNNGNLRSAGWAVSPYAAYRLAPNITIAAILGKTWVRYGENHPGTVGPGVSGRFDAVRLFGGADINERWKVKGWDVTTGVGYLYAREKQAAYVESNGNPVAVSTPYSGQARVTVGATREYPTTWGSLAPFVYGRTGYYVDRAERPVVDDKGNRAKWSDWTAEVGAGVDARLGERTRLRLDARTSKNGTLKNDGVSLTVRTAF